VFFFPGLLLKSWSPGLNASSQQEQSFLGKGIKVYYLSEKEQGRKNQPLKALSYF
jgi:hypothetical protein